MSSTAIQTIDTEARATMLRPLAPIDQIIEQQSELRRYIRAALKDGRDFGKIPGVDKPSLLKPGAERINTAYGVYGRFEIVSQEVDHDRTVEWRKRRKVYGGGNNGATWEETTGTSIGLYAYTVRCELVDRASGLVVADCIGSCSSMESKYVDRPRDSQNTVLKMAEKRALVGATLLAYGLSDEFTQDVEDTGGTSDTEGGSKAASNEPEAKCPVCGGRMWDNREGKTNPRAPDFKCRDKACKGVYWPGQWPPAPTKDAATPDDGAPPVSEPGDPGPTEPSLGLTDPTPTRSNRSAQSQGR